MTKRIFFYLLLLSLAFSVLPTVFAKELSPEISLYNLTEKPIHYFFTNRSKDTISGIVEPKESQPIVLIMIPPDNFLPTSTAMLIIINEKGDQILKYHFAFSYTASFYLSEVMYMDPHYQVSREIPSKIIMRLFVKSKK